MKDLKQYILENKKHVDTVSIGDFAKWYCLGEMPDGKDGKVTPVDCQNLLYNGWFDNFDDSDINKACQKIADFINQNWDKNIKVTSQETSNDWEISFEFNGTEYSVDAISYFGDNLDNKW